MCRLRLPLSISWMWNICKFPRLRVSFSVSVTKYTFFFFILLLLGGGEKNCVSSNFLFFYFSCRMWNCPPLPFALSQFPKSISLFLCLLFCLKQYLLGTTTSMPGHLSPFLIVTTAIFQDSSQHFILQISSDSCKSTLSSIFNSFLSCPHCFPSAFPQSVKYSSA